MQYLQLDPTSIIVLYVLQRENNDSIYVLTAFSLEILLETRVNKF